MLISAITSVAHDAQRNLLFLSSKAAIPLPCLYSNPSSSGLFGTHLTVCKAG
jgi:hypothetical protein